MVLARAHVHRSRRLATVSVLRPPQALGLACDGPTPSDGTWNDHYATINATANVRVMVTLVPLGETRASPRLSHTLTAVW